MIGFRQAAIPAFLMLSLVLGGASAGGYLANALLQLLAILLALCALVAAPPRALWPQERNLLIFVALGLLVLALQFVPLPLALWEALPQRKSIAAVAQLAGVEPEPLLLSLLPHEALKSAIWLLPPLGLLLAMIRLQLYEVGHLAWTILIAAMLSVLIGALQISGGEDTAWYFYQLTSRGSTVGFFANPNHLTTLLLTSLPFAAALIKASEQRRKPQRLLTVSLAAACGGVALVGIAVNGSLFGYGLVVPVLFASLLILAPRPRIRRRAAALLVPSVALGVVLVLANQEGQQMLAASSRISPEGREVIFTNTWKAIADFFPAGSGIGSFAEIYRLYEDPMAAGPVFINHAHNDFLEILLETGVLGGAMLAVFLAWWSWRIVRIWRATRMEPYAAAAAVASAVILVHSLVDYPLRTAAISCVFAVCLALLTLWINGDPLRVQRRQPNVDETR